MSKDSHSQSIGNLIRSRKFLVAFGSILALLSPLALLSNTAAENREEYLSVSTLDVNLKAESYFQGNNVVDLSERMQWNLKVSNGMKESQLLSVRIKVLNSTHVIPNDLSNTPSANPELYEYQILVPRNSEVIMPLEWSINDIEKQEGYQSIRTMMINGKVIDNLDIKSANGQNYRIVIELWRYDSSQESFSFAWVANNKVNSVWNQVWFSLDN